MAVDIWREWQRQTGIKVKFISSNWAQTLENVKSGVADVHVALAKNKERQQYLIYGEKVDSIASNLHIHKNIAGVFSFEQLTPFVVGTIKQAAHNKILKGYNPNVKFKYYDSRKALLDGIEANEVNVFIDLDFQGFQFHGFDRIAKNYPIYKSLVLANADLFFAVGKDKADLLPVIRDGFSKITEQKHAEILKRWSQHQFNPEALRLAISEGNEPYMSVNLAGEPTGLFVELWQKWADKNQIEIEFVPNDMQLALDSLLSNRVDVHIAYPESEAVKTGLERAKHLYSVYSKLFVPISHNTNKGLEQLNGKAIGLFRTAPYKLEFEQAFPQVQVVWFNNQDEMISAAARGEIYGFVAEQHAMNFRLGQNNLTGSFVALADVSYESKLYSLVQDNYGLIEKVRHGFSQLSQSELEAIEQKWLGRENANYFSNNAFRLSLTTEQKDWLQQVPELTVGVTENWKPYEFIDEFGNIQGITKDVLDIAEQLTGQKYNFELYSSWQELLSDFKTGELDMVANIAKSPEREQFAHFTEPFWQLYWAVATDKDLGKFDSIEQLYGKRIAIVEGYQILGQIYEKYPQILVTVVPSLADALALMEEGKIDGMLENMVVLSQFLQDQEAVNYKLHVLKGMKVNASRIGVRKDLVVQYEIMNKVVDSISDSQSKAILSKWFKINLDSGISYRVYWRNISLGVGIGCIILAVVLFWNRKLKKEILLRKEAEQRLKYLARHDVLTSLPNRSLLNDRLKLAIASHARTQQKMAVMFIDLDGFKEVNDHFGHGQGDELLKQVAQRLNKSVRTSDTVARIGGDEFVILVTHLEEYRQCEHVVVKVLADLERAFELNIGPVHISASIGIACYPNNGKNNDELLKAADDLMYEVKRDGKKGYQFAKNIVL